MGVAKGGLERFRDAPVLALSSFLESRAVLVRLALTHWPSVGFNQDNPFSIFSVSAVLSSRSHPDLREFILWFGAHIYLPRWSGPSSLSVAQLYRSESIFEGNDGNLPLSHALSLILLCFDRKA